MSALDRFRTITCVLLLASCGASTESDPDSSNELHPVPGCENIDPAACDTRTPDCQARLLSLAACMRGEGPGEVPPITLMTEAEYASYLQQKVAEQGAAPVPDHYEVALAQLQLSAPGGLSANTFIAQQVERVGGLYRWATKDILIIDHGAKFDPVNASNVLVHEFIHALQDRSIDLATLEEDQGTTYDRYLAVDALIEGEARFFQDRYAASMLGLDPKSIDWRSHFQSAVERDAAWLLSHDNRYSQSYDVFPYYWGARYVNFAWESGNVRGSYRATRTLPRNRAA